MGTLESAGNVLSMMKYNLLVSAKQEEVALNESNDIARNFLITLPGRVQSFPVLTLKPATMDMLLSVASSFHQHPDLNFQLTPRKKQFQQHEIDRGLLKGVPVIYPQVNANVTWSNKTNTTRLIENLGIMSMVKLEKRPTPTFFKLFNEFPEDPTRETARAAVILIPDDEELKGRESISQIITEARLEWKSNQDGSQLRLHRQHDRSNVFYAIGETTIHDRLTHVWFADLSTHNTNGNAPHHTPDQKSEPIAEMMRI